MRWEGAGSINVTGPISLAAQASEVQSGMRLVIACHDAVYFMDDDLQIVNTLRLRPTAHSLRVVTDPSYGTLILGLSRHNKKVCVWDGRGEVVFSWSRPWRRVVDAFWLSGSGLSRTLVVGTGFLGGGIYVLNLGQGTEWSALTGCLGTILALSCIPDTPEQPARIVACDRHGRLLLFSASGEQITAIGKPFEVAYFSCAIATTGFGGAVQILAADHVNRTLSGFDLDGKTRWRRQVSDDAIRSRGRFATSLLLEDGQFYWIVRSGVNELLVCDCSGEVVSSFASGDAIDDFAAIPNSDLPFGWGLAVLSGGLVRQHALRA